ncbi:translation initiation factor IF-2 N-terminal domain-containing protein [Actinomadura livida]|uniref:Translation initiation factor IF-2 N-terminal domain-containing protein n=1 Tax=Actinomadura livida TaxID=79909 RepID=A0A7W7IKZ3_9ACTN|nr:MULTISPECIES: translation initiation factor IF-2 N-terminal domain-containing protein [Actinomadura]MBB4779023.1 hypothetical protein [Actinomadura catellatispora]GGU01125.1 hypothetical protein GCM10010208_25880 [Actinomadura livida]
MTMRIYELAKELDVEIRVVMNTMHELGLFIRSAASSIAPEEEKQIREKLHRDP